MWIHSTRTQIQKMILYSKSGFKRSFKIFLVYKNKSESKNSRTQIQKVILYSKPVLNVRYKDFWKTKINLNQQNILWLHNSRTQIQKVILYSKSDLNVRFKDFWYCMCVFMVSKKLLKVKNSHQLNMFYFI